MLRIRFPPNTAIGIRILPGLESSSQAGGSAQVMPASIGFPSGELQIERAFEPTAFLAEEEFVRELFS